jgi:hypothetical protein
MSRHVLASDANRSWSAPSFQPDAANKAAFGSLVVAGRHQATQGAGPPIISLWLERPSRPAMVPQGAAATTRRGRRAGARDGRGRGRAGGGGGGGRRGRERRRWTGPGQGRPWWGRPRPGASAAGAAGGGRGSKRQRETGWERLEKR